MNEKSSRSSRSLLERAEQIFDVISKEEDIFPKSNLRDARLSPAAAEKWLELITFIQNQPRIKVIKTKRNTFVEKIGGKFSQMSLNFFLDENQPIEKRLQSLEAYAQSIFVQQRLAKRD